MMMDSLIEFASVLGNPLVSAGVIILAGFAFTHYAFAGHPIGRFFCALAFFIILTAALILAGIVPYAPTPSTSGATRYLVLSLYKILWWVVASRFLAAFVRAFMILETESKETRLLQDLLAGVIYLGAFFAVVTYVFDMPVPGLLATSGAVAIILGLALQSTLAGVFFRHRSQRCKAVPSW